MRTDLHHRREFLLGGTASIAAMAMSGSVRSQLVANIAEPAELTRLSVREMAKRLRQREVTCSELVQAHLQRVELVDKKINAVTYLAKDNAMENALAADQRLKLGKVDWNAQPLFGVPVTIKDNLETAGIPTTAGSPALKDYVPKSDATVVRRLRDAGAILLAKTNLPIFGSSYHTDNLVHQETLNPYDRGRSPGGSSGGEAALIASMGSPLGIGNDSSGSIRLPAHCCGIAGLCPALGRVSTAGVIADKSRSHIQNVAPFYWSVGPMARHIDDLRMAFSVISGRDYRDPYTFPLPKPKEVDLSELRIAWFCDTPDIHPTPEVANTVKSAAVSLHEHCAKVTERAPGVFSRAGSHDRVVAIVGNDVLEGMKQTMLENDANDDPELSEAHQFISRLLESKPSDLLSRLQTEWPVIQREMLFFMEDFDAIICPVSTHPAAPLNAVWSRAVEGAFVFTEIFSLVGQLPTGTVRCGDHAGLPIGVQVVGAPWREDIVLSILSHFESEFGGWKAPPI